MKQYEYESGNLVQKAPSFVCSLDEFTIETDAPDGSGLEVVDEDTDTVVSYHLAYKGRWRKR